MFSSPAEVNSVHASKFGIQSILWHVMQTLITLIYTQFILPLSLVILPGVTLTYQSFIALHTDLHLRHGEGSRTQHPFHGLYMAYG